MEGPITLIVKDQTGEETMFRILRTTEMGRLMDAYSDRKGVARDVLNFMIDGERLLRHDTANSRQLVDNDQIDSWLSQVGMISTFTSSDVSDPLIRYLMTTDQERVTPLIELQTNASLWADPTSTFHFEENPRIFHVLQRNVLCELLQLVWNDTANSENDNRVDIRLTVTFEQLVMILAPLDEWLDNQYNSAGLDMKLNNIFGAVPDADTESGCKIALRMTRGPTNSCINFHCDGDYASSTSQIPLNPASEYDGGELVYFMNNQLYHVPRIPGSLVQHPPNILHGVTSVTRGTRKSLFVVDESNGLGENGVIALTDNHVDAFSITVTYLIVRDDPLGFLERYGIGA